jgi:DNA (cytosine-5)-methyltransferase 1
MNELALFAGAGGGILGGKLLGWRTVCAVESDAYARSVLLARQRDGHLDRFPIWDDVKTFDGRKWRGSVDVVTAGWPCQDISCAGKGEGITGKRSGLWVEVARILGEVRPRHFLGENSSMLLANRGWRTVFGDLSALGYRYRWGVLGAHHAGAPHKRDRIWILASHADRNSKPAEPVDDEAPRVSGVATNADRAGQQEQRRTVAVQAQQPAIECSRSHMADSDGRRGHDAGVGRQRIPQNDRESSATWWEAEPNVGRVADGVAHRVDRLRAIGNGQVPAVAALAWITLGGPS